MYKVNKWIQNMNKLMFQQLLNLILDLLMNS